MATWPAMRAAKRAIFDRQTGEDTAVVGVDDDALARHGRRAARDGPRAW
jgi:hypothetical protein